MPKRRVLASWIGHTDLRAMASSLPEDKRKEIFDELGKPTSTDEGGPIKTLVDQGEFDEIHLLSDYNKERSQQFLQWLAGPAKLHTVELKSPVDYAAIFTFVDEILGKLASGPRWSETELCMHLSPGSPAMAAIWLLLGKSRYPATFYQTFKGKVIVTDIPFNLVVDFIPQVLRNADTHLLHLTAKSPAEVKGFEQIVGDSQAIRLAVGRARRAAIRSSPVLILGESGTGKEMFARAIHAASSRNSGPFVAINCAAIPKELLESELFGHKKGAFTGADKDRVGAFEEANGGTLFLDEVADCDISMQAKMLRVVQPPPAKGPCHRVYRRVGETQERTSDVRIVAATNRDLLTEITAGRFREDLYHRLAVVTIKLPPLRERRGDIPQIASALMTQINDQFRDDEPGYQDKSISAPAMEFVKRHNWPGNVRQLYNALLQAAIMAERDVLDRRDVADALTEMRTELPADVLDCPVGDGFDLEEHLNGIRRHFLERAMVEAGGVKTRAAKLLGIENYQTLDAQLKRLKVNVRKA